MKKKFLVLILGLMCSINLFGLNGVLKGERNLKVAKTQWFDIIYPESSETTAAILYKNLDNLYLEVNQYFGVEPYKRMPVVVTPASENINAYWTNYPYDHILVYDTVNIPDLEVFSESICSIVKHELAHAVTFNMKSDAYKLIGKIFGDPASLFFLTVTKGVAESATVNCESAKGEGRLNSEYFLHALKQAKIENNFPDYFDIQGLTTEKPRGSYYLFNAAFYEWLIEKYGMEKYAQFWYKLVNVKKLTLESCFHSVYSIRVNDAWALFVNELQVPDIPANPVESGIVKDFFEPSIKKYSILNNNGVAYSSLTASDSSVAFLCTDTKTVYMVPKKEISSVKVNPEKVFQIKGLQKISLASDNRFMSLDYFTADGDIYKAHVKIYDLQKKKFYELKETGVNNSTIIKSGEDYYLAVQKFKSQFSKINLYKIKLVNGEIKGFDFVKEISSSVEDVFYSITDIGNGEFCYLIQQGMDISLCVSSINNDKITKYKFPQKMVVRDLSFSKGKLYFSYTVPGSMPLLGKITLSDFEMELCQDTISGGIFNPVAVDNTILYKAEFLRMDRLFTMNESSGVKSQLTAVETNVQKEAENNKYPTLSQDILTLKDVSKNYNPFAYYTRGVLIPACSITSVSYDYEHGTSSYYLPFGFTYLSSNPWGSGQIQIGAGYGMRTKSFGTEFAYTSSGLINSSIYVSVEFDSNGWKQVNGALNLGKSISFGNSSTVSISNQTSVHYGRSNVSQAEFAKRLDKGMEEGIGNYFTVDVIPDDKNIYTHAQDQISLDYSNIVSKGYTGFNRAGFSTGVLGLVSYNARENVTDVMDYKAEAGTYILGYIPRLIPVESKYGYVYNLPSKFLISLFTDIPFTSSNSVFDYYHDLNFKSETVLFGRQIQKSVFNHSGLYMNNIWLALDYLCGVDFNPDKNGRTFNVMYLPEYMTNTINGKYDFVHDLYLKAVFGFTPNFGMLSIPDLSFNVGINAGVQIVNLSVTPKLDAGIVVSF